MSEHHFHSERCYAMGPGDTEKLICGGKDVPYAVDPISTVPTQAYRGSANYQRLILEIQGWKDALSKVLNERDALRAQLEEARKLYSDTMAEVGRLAAAHTALCDALRAFAYDLRQRGVIQAAIAFDLIEVLARHGGKE